MDEVIDDIISMQSNYDIQGFIDAVQMPNTVSESNAPLSLFSLTDPSSEFTPFSRSFNSNLTGNPVPPAFTLLLN